MANTHSSHPKRDTGSNTIERPHLYNVIVFEDGGTSVEHIEKLFDEALPESDDTTIYKNELKERGQTIIGTYTFDIAETKAACIADYFHQYQIHTMHCTLKAVN